MSSVIGYALGHIYDNPAFFSSLFSNFGIANTVGPRVMKRVSFEGFELDCLVKAAPALCFSKYLGLYSEDFNDQNLSHMLRHFFFNDLVRIDLQKCDITDAFAEELLRVRSLHELFIKDCSKLTARFYTICFTHENENVRRNVVRRVKFDVCNPQAHLMKNFSREDFVAEGMLDEIELAFRKPVTDKFGAFADYLCLYGTILTSCNAHTVKQLVFHGNNNNSASANKNTTQQQEEEDNFDFFDRYIKKMIPILTDLLLERAASCSRTFHEKMRMKELLALDGEEEEQKKEGDDDDNDDSDDELNGRDTQKYEEENAEGIFRFWLSELFFTLTTTQLHFSVGGLLLETRLLDAMHSLICTRIKCGGVADFCDSRLLFALTNIANQANEILKEKEEKEKKEEEKEKKELETEGGGNQQPQEEEDVEEVNTKKKKKKKKKYYTPLEKAALNFLLKFERLPSLSSSERGNDNNNQKEKGENEEEEDHQEEEEEELLQQQQQVTPWEMNLVQASSYFLSSPLAVATLPDGSVSSHHAVICFDAILKSLFSRLGLSYVHVHQNLQHSIYKRDQEAGKRMRDLIVYSSSSSSSSSSSGVKFNLVQALLCLVKRNIDAANNNNNSEDSGENENRNNKSEENTKKSNNNNIKKNSRQSKKKAVLEMSNSKHVELAMYIVHGILGTNQIPTPSTSSSYASSSSFISSTASHTTTAKQNKESIRHLVVDLVRLSPSSPTTSSSSSPSSSSSSSSVDVDGGALEVFFSHLSQILFEEFHSAFLEALVEIDADIEVTEKENSEAKLRNNKQSQEEKEEEEKRRKEEESSSDPFGFGFSAYSHISSSIHHPPFSGVLAPSSSTGLAKMLILKRNFGESCKNFFCLLDAFTTLKAEEQEGKGEEDQINVEQQRSRQILLCRYLESFLIKYELYTKYWNTHAGRVKQFYEDQLRFSSSSASFQKTKEKVTLVGQFANCTLLGLPACSKFDERLVQLTPEATKQETTSTTTTSWTVTAKERREAKEVVLEEELNMKKEKVKEQRRKSKK